MERRTRRHVLRLSGSTLLLPLAGCGEPAGEDGEEDDGEEAAAGEEDGGDDDGGGAYDLDLARNRVGPARD